MSPDLPTLESARCQEYEPRVGYTFDYRRGLVRTGSDGSATLAGSQQGDDLPEAVRKELARHGLNVKEDGVVVWSENSSAHPKDWPVGRKLYDTGIIVFLEFFTTAISNTGTSAAQTAHAEFGISEVLAIFAFTSIYLIGQALGSIILPPVTDNFGRKLPYVVSTILYAIFCVIVAAPRSLPAVFIGRFFSGAVSGMPTAVGAGSIEDLWGIEARIWVIGAWVAGATLGLATGPIVATYICTSSLSWPWVFYIAAIVSGIAALLSLGMHETRPSQLVQRHLAAVCKKTGYDKLPVQTPDPPPTWQSFVRDSLALPAVLFVTEPLVLVLTIMSASIYASIYLLTEALPVVYADYGFSERQRSLVFISIGVGLVFTLFTRLYDQRITQVRRRQNRSLEPEDKLFGFYVAAPALMIALWWFSWTIPPLTSGIHYFVSLPSLLFVGFAANEFDHVLTGYLTDSYTAVAASAVAPLAFLRAVLSAVYPLFGAQMFRGLGSNVAGSVLAALATVYCIAPVVLWKFGRRIRKKSRFATRMSEG